MGLPGVFHEGTLRCHDRLRGSQVHFMRFQDISEVFREVPVGLRDISGGL